jgi:hypothetical protein
MLADAYKAIDIIDWSLDIVVMHHKNHVPHPTISHFIASKQTMGHCYPCDQYVLSRKNAVHLHIRYCFKFLLKDIRFKLLFYACLCFSVGKWTEFTLKLGTLSRPNCL